MFDRLKFAWAAMKAYEPDQGSSIGSMMGSKWGQPPDHGTKGLLEMYSKSPWLRQAVSKVSTVVAGIPWRVYSVQGTQGRAILRRDMQQADLDNRQQMVRELKAEGDLVDLTEKHPIIPFLSQGNPLIVGLQARQVTQSWMDLVGDAYWMLERNGSGMPIRYWPVPPHWVQRTPTSDNPTFEMRFPGWQGDVPASEVVWFKDLDPANPYATGSGHARSLTDEVETDDYAAKHTKSWFYNRAVPELLIGVEGAGEAELRRAEHRWNEKHQGFWKAFQTHWHSGQLNVEQLGSTFQEMQLTELRQAERDTIIQTFGVSPEIMGIIENSNRATIDAADYVMSRWVIVPRMELQRAILQERLIPEYDDRLILDYENPIPADRDRQLDAAKAAPHIPTREDWREMQGLNPLEDVPDVQYLPVSLIPVDPSSGATTPPNPTEPGEESQVATEHKGQKVPVEDIDPIVNSVEGEVINRQTRGEYRELIAAFGRRALEETGVEPSFNLHNPRVDQHLNAVATNRIKGLVNETTKQELKAELVAGVREGEGADDLAKRVNTAFNRARGTRALTIARTEVMRSANFATYEAHHQSGVVDQHRWIATLDSRTRDPHMDMHRQTVKLTDPFTSPGGRTTMYPGSFGVAELDINCRCTTIAYDPRRTQEQEEAIWRGWDRELVPWERSFSAALGRGFQEQEKTVLSKLREVLQE